MFTSGSCCRHTLPGVAGVLGGVGSLGARAVRSSFTTRAAHAWHGAVFADPVAIAACLPRFRPGSSIVSLTTDDGALLEALRMRDPTLRPLDPAAVLAPAAGDGNPAPPPDIVLLGDVLHHVPPDERADLLDQLRGRASEDASFVVKEFAPGGLRARLGWLADRALSGDPVRFLDPVELRTLAAKVWPHLTAFWTPLFEMDPPNYCFVFRRLRLS